MLGNSLIVSLLVNRIISDLPIIFISRHSTILFKDIIRTKIVISSYKRVFHITNKPIYIVLKPKCLISTNPLIYHINAMPFFVYDSTKKTTSRS